MSKDVNVVEAAQRDAQRSQAAHGGHEQQAACLLSHVGKLIARCREADAEAVRLAGAVLRWLQEPQSEPAQQEAARAVAQAIGGHAGDVLRQIRALSGKAVAA